MHVKIVSNKSGGYLLPAATVAWDPIQSVAAANELNVMRLYDETDNEPGTLVGVWLGGDEKDAALRDFVFDVRKYRVYVLSDTGRTIDRIPD